MTIFRSSERRGGGGASSVTAAGGNTRIDLGADNGGGFGGLCRWTDEADNVKMQFGQQYDAYASLGFNSGANPSSAAGGGHSVNLYAYAFDFTADAGHLIRGQTSIVLAGSSIEHKSQGLKAFSTQVFGENAAPITTATTTVIKAWTSPNDKCGIGEAYITGANDTDNAGANFRITFGWKNIGGTVSLDGAPIVIPLSAVSQVAVSASVTVGAGAVLNFNLITDATDTVNADCTVEIKLQRVLA